MRGLWLGLVLLAVAACHPSPSPSNPTDADAGPVTPPPPAPAGHTCTQACAHRQALGCKFQLGCLDRCNLIGDQRFTDCEATAASCGAITSCDPANQ